MIGNKLVKEVGKEDNHQDCLSRGRESFHKFMLYLVSPGFFFFFYVFVSLKKRKKVYIITT